MFVHRQIEVFFFFKSLQEWDPPNFNTFNCSSVHFLFCLPLIMVMWLLDPVSSSPLEHRCLLFLLLGPNVLTFV